MLTNSDFRELLNLFKKHEIRYLVVGSYAVMKYSEPRFMKDLDVWIATDPENAQVIHPAEEKQKPKRPARSCEATGKRPFATIQGRPA